MKIGSKAKRKFRYCAQNTSCWMSIKPVGVSLLTNGSVSYEGFDWQTALLVKPPAQSSA
jgi:hypothetical protein